MGENMQNIRWILGNRRGWSKIWKEKYFLINQKIMEERNYFFGLYFGSKNKSSIFANAKWRGSSVG